MERRAFFRICTVAALLAGSLDPIWAQALDVDQATPNNYPPALPRRKGAPPPRLSFERIAEIPLPGLPAGDPKWIDGEVHIPLADAIAVTTLDPGSIPRLEPPASPPAAAGEDRADGTASPWVVSEDGKLRFRASPEGEVLAERRCSWCRNGWRTIWKLTVAGATVSPPLVRGPRLFFTTLANQVFAVRSDNGHRLWAADVEDRLSRPPALWNGIIPAPAQAPPGAPGERIDLLLVTPDEGAFIVALDPFDGSRVATHELPASEGRFSTQAIATEDGRVVVARETYEAEALLMVLAFELPAVPADAAEGGGGHDGNTKP